MKLKDTCSLEEKLWPTRQHIKNRDTVLLTTVCLVKAMVFPVVMYGWEGWTVKKAECWGIDAFELWCWRRLLGICWTAKRSNQSILMEISPECSLEGLMLKLKLQYFGHLMRRIDSLEDPDAGKDWWQEGKGTIEDEMVGCHHRPNGHELGYEKAMKNWCFWTVVLEKTLESLLDCKEIQPVHPNGNQSWMFIGRADAQAETPILWPPDVKNWLIWKDPEAEKDWRQKKGMTEDEMVGWHHWLDGHEFEQAVGVGDGQGSLVCCSPWGCKE